MQGLGKTERGDQGRDMDLTSQRSTMPVGGPLQVRDSLVVSYDVNDAMGLCRRAAVCAAYVRAEDHTGCRVAAGTARRALF